MRSSAPGRSWRSPVRRGRSAATAAVAIGGMAVLARLAYGPGFAGYDPTWSLIWGRQLTRGESPGFEALPVAPVPHPLANAAGTLASAWGGAGPAVLEAVGFLSLGLLGWAAFHLGRELYGAAVGVAFALVLLTAAPLVDASLQAVVDVPFLALVLLAAAREARSPDGYAPLVLLVLAGLLRPEAWGLAAALVGYRAVRGASRRAVLRWAALAALAPGLWTLSDLVATGDPLHSLHVTRSFGGLLGVPSGTDTALGEAPRFLRFFLADPVVWAGLAGLVAGLALAYRRSILPAALLGLGLAALVTLGVAGVPLSYRYAVVPAGVLALLAAVAAVGWTALPPGRDRSRWRALGLAGGLVVVVLAAPGILSDLKAVTDRAERTRADQRALRSALEQPGVPARLRACQPVLVRGFLTVPSVAYWADVDPAGLTLRPTGARATVARGRGGRWVVSARC